ncbi:MAG: tyrosine phosphatase family protein [Phenylobacterium sp.]
MTLIISPLSRIAEVIAARRPSHLISLMDPAQLISTPKGFEAARHLRLGVNDISQPTEGLVLPGETHVLQILQFGQGWDESSPLLVHCWAGISRSTATAFMLACERNPETDERDIAWRLRRSAAHAYPNRRLVTLADDLLGRRGRMVDAVDAIGPNNFEIEGVPFDLPARF